MYKVVEFENGADGVEVSVVRRDWLTPKKGKCHWPPVKAASKFAKLLSSPGPTGLPDENWPVHQIRKILYETDDLIKARQKCKQAEKESEVATDEDDNFINRKRKRIPTRKYSSDEELEDESYQMKFPNVHKNLVNYSPKTDNQSLKKKASRLLLEDFNVDTPTPSSPAVEVLEEYQTPKQMKCNTLQSTLDRVADLLGDIQSELKELRLTQNEILNKISLSASARQLLLEELPIALPIQSLEDIDNAETWLEDEENREILAKYLSFIGGNKTKVVTRKILEKVFENSFAATCNWTGKNNKKCLKEMRVIKTIFDAIRRNHVAEKATDSEITEVLTSWFRFAKDRDGGREKRRSTSLPPKE